MLIPRDQDEVESKIEDECDRRHDGDLLFLFDAHECGAQDSVDVKKDESRGKGLENRDAVDELSLMIEEANDVGCCNCQCCGDRDAAKEQEVHGLLNGQFQICFIGKGKLRKDRIHEGIS